MNNQGRRVSSAGFTLVELLVVIGIIAVLVGILMPALSVARESSMALKSMSNLRQLAIGLDMYKVENKGCYPVGAWPAVTGQPRVRWADVIFPYMQNTEVYLSPLLTDGELERMKKPFAHTTDQATGAVTAGTIFFGGYGYNYQYLGNGRFSPGAAGPYNRPFQARASEIKKSSQTIALADTNGSKDGFGAGEGVYVVDPPMQSLNLGSKGSRKDTSKPAATGNYGYRGGNDGEPADSQYRALPVERNRKKVNVLFCDGHGEPMALATMDDSNGDRVPDNGFWNGLGLPDIR